MSRMTRRGSEIDNHDDDNIDINGRLYFSVISGYYEFVIKDRLTKYQRIDCHISLVELKYNYDTNFLKTFTNSVTRLGNLLDFGQQLMCPNLPHSLAIFVKVLKSIIFLVKSFLGNFYRQFAYFSGHTVSPTTFHTPNINYDFKEERKE